MAVSDFITPHFYDPVVTPGTRYSFTGAIKAPRQILKGGYISWVNQETDQLQQLLYVDGPPKIVTLGPAQGASLREWVDATVGGSTNKLKDRVARKSTNEALLEHCKAKRTALDAIAIARGARYDHPRRRTAGAQ